jgi:hypothetical protein
MENKDLTGLRYSIPQRELKYLGYKMLHKRDGYILEIEQWVCTIWIWLAGKTIHVNDWYDRTYDVIEFYKANRDNEKFINDEYLPIIFDYVTGEFIINTKYEELDEVMKKIFGRRKAMDELLKKYEKFKGCREVYLKKANMDKLIIEIEKLKQIQKYAGTPVS